MALIVTMWATVLSFALSFFVGLKFEVRGQSNLIESKVIYAAKHQSAWDTFAYFLILKNPSYVLEKELLRIPFWGICARRYKAVIVDRRGGSKALRKMVVDVRERLNADMPIIIFPEGTRRSLDEESSYQSGVAALYRATDVPVVPVATNSGFFWGRRSFRKSPGIIVVEFLPAIQSGMNRDAFMEALESRIETATKKLVEEAKVKFGG